MEENTMHKIRVPEKPLGPSGVFLILFGFFRSENADKAKPPL
jgi:hypothetical protein